MPELVPVELTLPSGTWVTLYQRGWDDADDDSLAFLGGDDAVYAFATAEDLSSYAISGGEHHLTDSALWPGIHRWSRTQFMPGPEDRYDLTVPSPDSEAMLSELLGYLRIEAPKWGPNPLAEVLPRAGSLTGLPAGVGDAQPVGERRMLWGWAVAEIDARVGKPPSAGGPALVLAPPIEEVAPGVECLWLGLDGEGAHTLLVRDDEAGWQFLGEPGQVVASASAAGLMAFVCHGEDEVLEGGPWVALHGRDDVDFEPFEDNIVDLDELGSLLGPSLDRTAASALLDARPLVQELASWLELDDVVTAFDEDQPLGRFFIRDLLDLVSGSGNASSRLREVDFDPIAVSWQTSVAAIAGRVHWVD